MSFPKTFKKGDQVRVAYTPADEVAVAFDGFKEVHDVDITPGDPSGFLVDPVPPVPAPDENPVLADGLTDHPTEDDVEAASVEPNSFEPDPTVSAVRDVEVLPPVETPRERRQRSLDKLVARPKTDKAQEDSK